MRDESFRYSNMVTASVTHLLAQPRGTLNTIEHILTCVKISFPLLNDLSLNSFYIAFQGGVNTLTSTLGSVTAQHIIILTPNCSIDHQLKKKDNIVKAFLFLHLSLDLRQTAQTNLHQIQVLL